MKDKMVENKSKGKRKYYCFMKKDRKIIEYCIVVTGKRQPIDKPYKLGPLERNIPIENTIYKNPIKGIFKFYSNGDTGIPGDFTNDFISERLFNFIKEYINPEYISCQEVYIKDIQGTEHLYYFLHQCKDISNDITTEYFSESFDEIILRSGQIFVSADLKREIRKLGFINNIKFGEFDAKFDLNPNYKKEE